MNRRRFLQVTGGAAAAVLAASRRAFAFSQSKPLQMFTMPLRGAAQIPVLSPDTSVSGLDKYHIRVAEFTDQLHTQLPKATKLWGYGNAADPVSAMRHLGGIIISRKGRPAQLRFRNELPSTHIIPVDSTIPGANQAHNRIAVHLHGGLVPWFSDGGPFDWWAPNGTRGSSCLNGSGTTIPFPGGTAGMLPSEAIYYYPNEQGARMLWYHDHAWGITRLNAYAGVATAYIIRDPDGWEGLAKTNGTIPKYIEEGGLELPLVVQDKIFKNNNPAAMRAFPQYESPAGDLWYPYMYERNRWGLTWKGVQPRIPSCVAEFFGDTMLVNGTVYPTVTVAPRRYRFRVLNACNARFLNLQLYVSDGTPDGVTLTSVSRGGVTWFNPDPSKAGPAWLQIGSESGFLPAPVTIPTRPFYLDPAAGDTTDFSGMETSLFLGPAERADVLVDFSGYSAGTKIILYSDTPSPFPGGDPLNDYKPKGTGMGPCTRILMQFVVGTTSLDPDIPLNTGIGKATLDAMTTDPAPLLVAPSTGLDRPPLADPPYSVKRRLTLNEDTDSYGRLIQFLGTDVQTGTDPVSGIPLFGKEYMAAPTETPKIGQVEIWEIANLTGDTHPIHFHLVDGQILWRSGFDWQNYAGGAPTLLGSKYGPNPNERGWKETIQLNPGEVTSIAFKFHYPADKMPAGFNSVFSPRFYGKYEYVWHCHILEHEEHDMMRPLVVTP